ncbi:MAG: AraC family transcriptional regulator ligand-binding domain-containing protein [Geminicoccaceae bacterium]
MARPLPPMTTATGFGPLPDLLLEAAGRAGVRRAFAQAGLPEEVVADRSHRFPLECMVRLFAESGLRAGDRLFGLRVGQAMAPEDYGLWARYALSARTLRAAIGRLAWALPLHQTGPSVSLYARGGSAVFAYHAPRFAGVDARQHVDHVVPTMLEIVRRYLGPDWSPAWIGLPYARDDKAELLAEALGIVAHVDTAAILVPLSQAELDVPARNHGAGTAQPTRSDVQARLRRNPACAVAVIEDCIRIELLAGRSDINGVASRLGASKRSLQRMLAQENTSYSLLLDKVRRVKAVELLRAPNAQIGQIALALGYADPSNFTRAYRKWTGTTPSVTRRGDIG